jgi:phenylalanyl-tRNA synthetase beta chain
MRVPLSWLKEYVDWEEPLAELVERLTVAGLEVASIEYIGKRPAGELPKLGRQAKRGLDYPQDGHRWDGTYVGELLEVKPHLNADTLVIAVVDYGRGPVESVTGAPNVRIGDKGRKVAVAGAGATLIDPHAEGERLIEVEPATIRGVRSEVVLCSERELGISDDHSGILILDEDAAIGTPLVELLGDVVLEFDLTPNLARCFSVIGVAREVVALTRQKFKTPEVEWQPGKEPIAGQVEVEIEDPDLCLRYCAALIKGVSIKKSPFWMRRRLTLAGMRPINNIVDITNYVMIEWGQPLHAFDYRRLHGRDGGPPVVIIRRAKPGERIITLDEVERELSEDMLLITDPGGPIAIAGVIGGRESEVTESTKDVLLESANFSNTNNRRTVQTLKLMSEAAARFGRGIPAELTIPALKRAAELMRKLASGKLAEGIVDSYPVKQERGEIEFDPHEVERLLGMEVPEEEIEEILERLEFACARLVGKCKPKDKKIIVKVPSHRLDVSSPADLVEEVARVIGYDKIPLTLMADSLPPQRRDRPQELEGEIKDILVGCGLCEVITYSLTSLELAAKLRPKEHEVDSACARLMDKGYLRVANPLSREREYLRRSLLPEMLMTAAENLKHRERIAIFEVGRVYLPTETAKRPQEPRRLGIVISGPRFELSWHERPQKMDLFDLKGPVEELLRRLGIEDYQFTRSNTLEEDTGTSSPGLHSGRAAELLLGKEPVGIIGELHPQVRVNFDIPEQAVIVAELDLEALLAKAGEVRRYRPLSQFPAVGRDLAIVVDEKVPAAGVAEVIREAGGGLLRELALFDVYCGEPIPPGKRSLAYRLRLQAQDRTLTDEEADEIHARIERQLKEELSAELRK